MTDRRPGSHLLAAGLSAAALGLAGCAGLGPEWTEVDGRPCVTFRKTYQLHRMCSDRPAPEAAAVGEAMRLEPLPDAGLLWVHWLSRSGFTRPLDLSLDGQRIAPLLPGGAVRLQVSPGQHRLAVECQGGLAEARVDVAAGDMRFMEVDGAPAFAAFACAWRPPDDRAGAAARARSARLTADVDVRGATMPRSDSVRPHPENARTP